MRVSILTSDKEIYSGQTKSVILPGINGEMEILDNHAPLFSLLTKGEIIIGKHIFPIHHGIVEVLNNRVVILIKE